jgi:NAD(P)-dependent dehydrogenase (short-subunit alcohol dehydrogenase family)
MLAAASASTTSRMTALVCACLTTPWGFWLIRTADTHFQINHLAQMHLIQQLLPILQKTAKEHQDARIVVQSSSMHNLAPSSVKFENIDEINTDIGPSYLYHRSKLAQILFIRGLVQRLNDVDSTNLFVNATHPGAVNTTQPEQAEEAYGMLGKVVAAGIRPFMKDPITQGCLPALFAATSPDVKTQRITGQYVSVSLPVRLCNGLNGADYSPGKYIGAVIAGTEPGAGGQPVGAQREAFAWETGMSRVVEAFSVF